MLRSDSTGRFLTSEEEKLYFTWSGLKAPDVPDGVNIRLAEPKDYNSVMEMSSSSDIFEGHDYLSIRYEEYAKDPDRYMFLAEKNNKVVCMNKITQINSPEWV